MLSSEKLRQRGAEQTWIASPGVTMCCWPR